MWNLKAHLLMVAVYIWASNMGAKSIRGERTERYLHQDAKERKNLSWRDKIDKKTIHGDLWLIT